MAEICLLSGWFHLMQSLDEAGLAGRLKGVGRGIAMRRGTDVMLRGLFAAAFVVVGSAGAHAAACTASSLPSGDTLQTVKTSSGPPITGGLNNTSLPAGLECEPDSTWLIPFSVASAGDVLISISEANSSVTGTYFGVLVGDASGNNTTSYDQTAILSTVLGSFDETVPVSAGVGTVSIVEMTSASSFGINGTNDTLSFSMAFQNFIPEPATLSLLGFGVACLVAARRRRRPA
jgi:hypothetical protein